MKKLFADISSHGFGFVMTNALDIDIDAIIAKPGYGTFVEAAIQGVPVLYLPRPGWPEQPCLVEWLRGHGRAVAITREEAQAGHLLPLIDGDAA